MKKIIVFISMIGLLAVACDKEPTHDIDILGEWQVTEYTIEGVGDLLQSEYTNITFEFDDNKNIDQTWEYDFYGESQLDSYSGKWSINENTLDVDLLSPESTHCNNFNETRHEYGIIGTINNTFTIMGSCTRLPTDSLPQPEIIIKAERI